jgi:ABC-type branched-subunit amino acid transport system substrate-binding protein
MHRIALALALSLLSGWASADIVIGQTTSFSGPNGPAHKEATDAAKAYFERVNAAGGINGQMLQLVTLDDNNNPKLAEANAKKLISENQAVTLFLTGGTEVSHSLQPLLNQAHVPLVAPQSGAMVLNQPVDPWVFNVRAPYQREAEKAVLHLAHMGVSRIGVAEVDDLFGNDAAIGALQGFDKAHLRAAFVLKFKPNKIDYIQISNGVAKLDLQALVVIGPAEMVTRSVKELRIRGLKATVVTMSNNASPQFTKLAGEYGRGMIVGQAMPDERMLSVPMVKEALDTMSAKGVGELTPAMLEGFAGAKVVVEALRKAGNNPNPAKLRDALNGLQHLNLGGYEVSFSPKSHTGTEYIDIAIVGPEGKFQR